MIQHPKKKLIEVALPLDAINTASAREKSIRHGHPSTLHLGGAGCMVKYVQRPFTGEPAFCVTCATHEVAGHMAHAVKP